MEVTDERVAAAASHRVTYHPGTRLAAHAEIGLTDLEGRSRIISLQPGSALPHEGAGIRPSAVGAGGAEGRTGDRGRVVRPGGPSRCSLRRICTCSGSCGPRTVGVRVSAFSSNWSWHRASPQDSWICSTERPPGELESLPDPPLDREEELPWAATGRPGRRVSASPSVSGAKRRPPSTGTGTFSHPGRLFRTVLPVVPGRGTQHLLQRSRPTRRARARRTDGPHLRQSGDGHADGLHLSRTARSGGTIRRSARRSGCSKG